MVKAIILDDELSGRKNLESMIGEYCEQIEVPGTFEYPHEARAFLEHNPVDAIFLDIMMPQQDGFRFLQSLDKQYAVVFVTAYDQFAIKAIRASAVDYLLKPLRISDLIETEKRLVAAIEEKRSVSGSADDMLSPLKVFFENLNATQQLKKITLHHQKGFNVIDIDKIIRLEADGNYTTFYIEDSEKIVSSRSIKDFEQILDASAFVRIHKSHIINLKYMEQYSSEDVGYAILWGGHKVEVSRRRYPVLFVRLSSYSKETKLS